MGWMKRLLIALTVLSVSATACGAANEVLREYVLTSKNTLLAMPVGATVLGVDMDRYVRLFVLEPVAEDVTEQRRFRALPADVPFNPATGPYTYVGSIWVRKGHYAPGERGIEWLHWAEDLSP